MVAYSTQSHISIMIVGLGRGLRDAVICHLFSHAWLKALLFMCVGLAIYGSRHSQDVRLLSRVVSRSVIMQIFIFVSLISLCALPSMVVFFSKESLLEQHPSVRVPILGVVYTLRISLRVAYRYRLYRYLLVPSSLGSDLRFPSELK